MFGRACSISLQHFRLQNLGALAAYDTARSKVWDSHDDQGDYTAIALAAFGPTVEENTLGSKASGSTLELNKDGVVITSPQGRVTWKINAVELEITTSVSQGVVFRFSSCAIGVQSLTIRGQSPTAKPAAPLPLGSISGFVWDDTPTKDSIYTFSDMPLPNVPISLHECDSDKLVQATISSSDGTFNLRNLLSGRYRVRVIPAENQEWGYVSKKVNEGLANNQIIGEDSDVNTDGATDCIEVNDGLQALVYAGLTQPIATRVTESPTTKPTLRPTISSTAKATAKPAPTGSSFSGGLIGGYSFRDVKDDGIRPIILLEPAVPNVNIRLYSCNLPDNQDDELLAIQRTDSQGFYSFRNLFKGSYRVDVSPPNGFKHGTVWTGIDESVDNSIDPATGSTVCFSLNGDETDISYDIALVADSSTTNEPTQTPANDSFGSTVIVSGFVFYDVDNDGYFDPVDKETPLPGLQAALFNCTGSLLYIGNTDENGMYGFNDLEPGEYLVKFLPPEGYAVSDIWSGLKNQEGNFVAVDATNDANPETSSSVCRDYNAGEAEFQLNAGMYLLDAGCTNDGDNPCSGCPCESEMQCRSSSGLCGVGIAFCNPLSLWRADCPGPEEDAEDTQYDEITTDLPDQNSTESPAVTPFEDSSQCNEDGTVGNTNSSGVISQELSFLYSLKSKNGQSPDGLLISEFERQLQDRLSCVYFDYPCLMCNESDLTMAKNSVRKLQSASVLTGLAQRPQDFILPLKGKFRRIGQLDVIL